jgi:putative ABC transport system substrate-binding protein
MLIAAGSLLAAPLAWAQTGGKARRIAFVNTTSPLAEITGPEPSHPGFRAFTQELRARGWIEGQNLVLDRRSAEGRFERASAIFTEVALGGAEVIFTNSAGFVKAAMKAAPAVPIVMIASLAVEEGIVGSLARPGGNVTGVTADVGATLHAKRLELLKAMLPRANRVALLTTQVATAGALGVAAMHERARALGIELFDATWSDNTFDAAFKLIEAKRPDAVLIHRVAPHYARRAEIVSFMQRARLPDFHGYREATEIGGLSSYGTDVIDQHRKAAGYVDRILKGARPGDLPIEQPSKFELAINLKTAKALGITIPQSILVRADKVIE